MPLPFCARRVFTAVLSEGFLAAACGYKIIFVEPDLPSAEPRVSPKGKLSLIVAVAVVAAVLIFFPAYRLFFAISVGIGIVVAGILYLRNKYLPVKEEEIHNNKRPLGLG